MKQYDVRYQLDENRFFQKMHLNGNDSLNRQIRAVVSGLKQIAERTIDIQAWYLEENREWHTGVDEVDNCENKIICLLYIAQKDADILEEKERQGEYLEEYILHEMINDMLFYASAQLYGYLEKRYREKGCYLTRQFFPGENGVPLELQKSLLDRMKKEGELEIEVNSHDMLVPEKALLYVLGADEKNKTIKWKHDCSMCDKIDCYLRNTEQDADREES